MKYVKTLRASMPSPSRTFWLMGAMVSVTIWLALDLASRSLGFLTTPNVTDSNPPPPASLSPSVALTLRPPTASPLLPTGWRFFENADEPAICFVSMEWNCFGAVQGGLGRAFLGQAAAALRDGEYPVRGILLPLNAQDRADSQPKQRCPGDPDADIVAPYLIGVDFDLAWYRGASVTYSAMLLLEWVRRHPDACRIMHVPDWNGFGVYVALAVRAALPEFRNLHVNVQVHGPQFLLSLKGLQDSLGTYDLVRAAQERLALEHADTVTFLNRESLQDISALSRVSPNVMIIPNILHPIPSDYRKQPPPMGRPAHLKFKWVFFYGKICVRKGFHLFLRAMSLLAAKHARDAHSRLDLIVAIVGPLRMDANELRAMIKAYYEITGRFLLVYDKLNRWQVLDLFMDHARDAIVVLPSYFEVQSYALFDVMQAGIPFIASNISAHRAQIPEPLHKHVLVTGTEYEFAERLQDLVENGVEWQPMYYAIPYDAREKWRDWHKKVMGSPLKAKRATAVAEGGESAGEGEMATPSSQGESPQGRFRDKPATSRDLAESQDVGKKLKQPRGRQSLAKSDMPLPPITVVVSVCDRISFIRYAVQSIVKQTLARDLVHVIITAGCPGTFQCKDILQAVQLEGEASAEASGRAEPRVSPTCIDATSTRASLGRMRNEAARFARTDLVLYLNDDDELPTDALTIYARAAMLNSGRAVFTTFADAFLEMENMPPKDLEGSRGRTRIAHQRLALLGGTPESALVFNLMGASSMLVNRSSPFWQTSGGFTDQIGVKCANWEFLAKAALVEQIQLVPVRGLWSRQLLKMTGVPGKPMAFGTLPRETPRDHYLQCRFRVIQGALAFVDHPDVRMEHRRWTTLMQYVLTWSERFDQAPF